MYKHISKLFFASALAACTSTTSPSTSIGAQQIDKNACPADVPAALAPAADQDLAFDLNAIGVQKYTCNGTAWVFVGPQADLYLPNNDQTVIGQHFAGATGPTWEYEDGSTIIGKKAAAVTVDKASIPWLLLLAIGHNDIDGRMTDVTSVQRLETNGGTAPATGCDADHAGVEADVPYTATYYFYVTRDPSKPNNLRCGA